MKQPQCRADQKVAVGIFGHPVNDIRLTIVAREKCSKHRRVGTVLLEALLSYGGTIVIVAHDRYILDRLPTQVIEVGSGQAHKYLGNYEDYVRAKAAADERAAKASATRRTGAR